MNKRKITKWVAASIATTTLVAIGFQFLPSPRNATADETDHVFTTPPVGPSGAVYETSKPPQQVSIEVAPGVYAPPNHLPRFNDGSVKTLSFPVTSTVLGPDGRPTQVTKLSTIHATSDGKRFDDIETANIHEETLKLTARYRQEKDADAKATIRISLVEAITKEYDALRAVRLKEIDELEKKLADVKANLAKRDEVKDKIIERHVEQLLGVDPLYQWDATPVQTGYAQPANQFQFNVQNHSSFRNAPNQLNSGNSFGRLESQGWQNPSVAYPSNGNVPLQPDNPSFRNHMPSSHAPNKISPLSSQLPTSTLPRDSLPPSFPAPEQASTGEKAESLQQALKELENMLEHLESLKDDQRESLDDAAEKDALRRTIDTLKSYFPKTSIATEKVLPAS